MSNQNLSGISVVAKRSREAGHVVWNVLIVVALIASGALFVANRQLAGTIAKMDQRQQDQVAKLSEELSSSNMAAQQNVDTVAKQSQQAAAQATASAEERIRKASSSLNAQLLRQQKAAEEAHQQVSGQLSDLQQATTSKFGEITGDVSGVKTQVASTQTELEKTGTDLKRVMGDMGVMSGLIATNSTQLGALRELGERDYLEFTLRKGAKQQKVGDLQLTLSKVDPKRNRYTMIVLADDKTVEKRDRSINEPVQLYLAGNRQPEEIVVNQVNKDEVKGYLSVPKVKMARR
jgi:hypothetical protein